MKRSFEPVYFVIAAVALVAGVLLDRFLLPQPSIQPLPQVSVEEAAEPSSTPAPVIAHTTDEVSAPAQTAEKSDKSLDAILSGRDPQQRMSELETFINSLGPNSYADALKRIRQMAGSNERELASRLLVARWVQNDPDAALQFAAGNRGYEYIADNVFEKLASTDPQGALERAKSLPSGDLRYMALRGVLGFMADTDPAATLALAQSLGDFRGNEPLSSVVYRQWAAKDPQAAALRASQDGQGEGWRSPVGQVVRTWADQDPAAAANFSLTLANTEAQARSMGQIMRQWGREDPQAAANWVNSLPPGGGHDTAIAALASSIASNDLNAAISWVGNISDEGIRNNALQRISREVMWRDPKEGVARLQAAGVPANFTVQQPRRRGPDGR